MIKTEHGDLDSPQDPAPAFPTAAEIELADELRHRLEDRYLTEKPAELPASARRSDGFH